MDHIKVIKTEDEHKQALERLLSLMDVDPEIGSREADELDVLALLIEQYEVEHFPIDPLDPIEAIRFRMDQQGLKNKDLIAYIGSASKVTEVLNGKRNLSLNMIRKLSAGLGIPVEVLIREPIQQNACETDLDWNSFPLGEMRKRSYFDGFSGSLRELREYAPEWISKFLASVPSGKSLQPTMLRSTAHYRSNEKKTDLYALWAWQVRVLQKAQEERIGEVYKGGTLDLVSMRKIAQLSLFHQGPKLAIEYLNRYGIHVVFEPHLPKTYLDGAVCPKGSGNPVVALTLRYDRLDSFWFTLMHELAHIALHYDRKEDWFIDDLDSSEIDELEQQADSLAQKALVPEEAWTNLYPLEPDSIRNLAKSLSINPCIIAGRLRHENNNHRMFGTLFREKIQLN